MLVLITHNSSVFRLCLDIGLVASDKLLELEQVRRELDLGLQEVLGIEVVLGLVVRVLLNVQADGGSR